MSAATLAASTSLIAGLSAKSATATRIPDALQQFLHRIEEQCTLNPRASQDLDGLKSDLESRWLIASSQGHTSSTMLYEILEYGWKEWQRITS